jgi:bifunctional non-homologous end joining protein LigD
VRATRRVTRRGTAPGRDPLPRFVAPQLATLVADPPEGRDWVYEWKFDGYRIQARIERGAARLFSRGGNEWTARMPTLARALGALPAGRALLDGEVVVLREGGLSDFQALQNAISARDDSRCVYFAFDLLHLDGHDLRRRPLARRKEALRELLAGADDRTRYSEHVGGRGAEFFRAACARGAEGAMCKLADAPYRSGRSRDWLKVKCKSRQEFVIGGYTAPSGARAHLGALLIGEHGPGGELRYAGKVGTGFTAQSLAELHGKLRALERRESPFDPAPRGAEARGVRWVRPELVAEVEYTERTRGGRVRHPSFHGLREDKPAMQVTPEKPAPAGPRLTHPDRLVYPELGITKLDLARYYAEVAPFLLPHAAGRPLTLVRCPQGRTGPSFFQKHPGRGTPEAIQRVPVRESGGVAEYMAVADVEGLVGLVQLGALEIHAWGARAPDLEHPDQLTFDLDPDPGVAWKDVVAAARALRDRLERLGLESFAKTTGGKGLHVVAPLAPRATFDQVKGFARALVDELVAREPERYLAKASKAARRGKIFLDYLRNARGATAVCPYSTRAREGAPVATPVAWSEVTARLDPKRFTLLSLPRRLAKAARDPWEGYTKVRQSLPALR